MSKQFDLYEEITKLEEPARKDSQTMHEELVARLCKNGEAILAELSPIDAHCMHMAMGIAGEAGEIVDLVKKAVVYGKQVELEKYIEEMGDLEFYLQGLRSGLGIDRPTVLDANIVKLNKRYGADKYTDEAAIARADKAMKATFDEMYQLSTEARSKQSRPRILILGYARSGKDTFAEMFCKTMSRTKGLSLTFRSSSLFACEKVVLPAFREKVEAGDWFTPDYNSVQECYEDRGNYRAFWYEAIKEYNAADGARLAKELLAESDIYVGMRNIAEFKACVAQGVFDLIIWVDATSRVLVEDSSSMTITLRDVKDCGLDYWIADNNFDLDYISFTALNTVLTVYDRLMYLAKLRTERQAVMPPTPQPEKQPEKQKLTISELTSAQLQAYRYTMQAINLFANYGPDLPIQAIRREFEDSFFFCPENFVIR